VLILDTDLLTIVQRREGRTFEILADRIRHASERAYITIVSCEEQTRGWLSYVAKRRTPDDLAVAYGRLRRLFDDFALRPIIDFDDDAATVLNRLRRARIRVGEMDLRIASIAISQNALLLTRNLQDFRKVPELRAEDWTREGPAGE
jgi:tRNA(fMet)-specific endonuclease VapC